MFVGAAPGSSRKANPEPIGGRGPIELHYAFRMSKLTPEKRRELQQLAARTDRQIDLTDIPEIREIPSDAVIGKFYRPKKTTVTIRLDADVLAWLKTTGEGYQTRINAYLRELMQRSR